MVPAEYLISLTSSLTNCLEIEDVSGCDLVRIMDSLKCEKIQISKQSLNSEETRALIRAFDSRVKELDLLDNVALDLDISDLSKFDGKAGRKFFHWMKIKEKLSNCDSLSDITVAASLAHHGLLGSISHLSLHDVDLSSIPAEHLASLASCVYQYISLENVIGNLVSFLDGIKKCQLLVISTLGREETQALVRAMETSVYKVCLGGDYGLVSVDIDVLSLYSGTGHCQEISCYDKSKSKSKDALRSWAKTKNWNVFTTSSLFSEHLLNLAGPVCSHVQTN